jgi:hypothetical protein
MNSIGFLPRIIIAGLLFIAAGCSSEPDPVPAGKDELKLEIIKEIPGFSKMQIYEQAKLWLSSGFSSDLDVIQYSNRYKGVILGQTYIPHVRPKKIGRDERFEFRFKVKIDTKDNKIRVRFTDMYLYGVFGVDQIYKKDMEEVRPKLEKSVEILAASFIKPAEDEDW